MVAVRFMPWLMWGFATLYFAYQFIMRLTPGLVMPELMQTFNIDATAYGYFAAIYYVAYAGMQIPVAVLLDRYGPKYVISVCALICSLGTLMLVYTNHWVFALASRLLIGAGSAAGFLGTSKIIASWFPEKQYTRMVGLTFTFGLLGAVYGGKPVGSLIAQFGWVDVLALVGWIGVAIAALVAVVVKNSPAVAQNTNYQHSVLANLKAVLCNKKLVTLALINFLLVGSLEGFADVWGVPYLCATQGVLKEEAAQFVSLVYIGMLFGGPVLAYIAEKLGSNYLVTAGAGVLMGLTFVLMLSLNTNSPANALYALLFFTGILCCYQVIVFSIGVGFVPKHLSSITVAFLNCINMFGGSFFHSVIGKLLDFNWNGAVANNVHVYDVSAFTYALSVIPITSVLGGVLIFWIMPKKSKVTSNLISAP